MASKLACRRIGPAETKSKAARWRKCIINKKPIIAQAKNVLINHRNKMKSAKYRNDMAKYMRPLLIHLVSWRVIDELSMTSP